MRMSIDAENLLSTPLPMRSLRQSAGASSKLHINPSVLVIVIILSVVFLCSGILHILARCLGRRRARQPSGPGGASGSSPSNSLRGQLQHLFSLHDSGVEQVFIDTLPVFLYGSIRGLKDSADCAVCLTEFANEDKLRLLPKCKHAFHTECIDTWLLSNSTCPLCRRSLLPDVTPCAPPDEQPNLSANPNPSASFRGSFRASLRGSFRFLTESVTPAPARDPAPATAPAPEPATPPMTPGPTVSVPQPDGSEKTLRVELGRVNVDRITASTSRMARSYSMGSYEYVVDFASFGLAGLAGLQRPTHRATLSDGIPELSSAGHTPGQEDLFWASRGLDTPHSLSRVREIMTPSPGWNSSPLFLASKQRKQKKQQQQQHEDDEDDDDEEGGEIKALTRVKKPNPNPNSRTSLEMVEVSAVATTDMFVEKQDGEEDVTRLKNSSPNLNSRTSVEMVEAPVGGETKASTRVKEFSSNPNSRTSVEMVEVGEKQDGEEEDEEVLKGKEEALLPRALSLALMRSPVQELGAASRKDKVWEVSVDVSEPERSPSSKKSSPLNWLRGRGRRLVYSAASPSANDLQQHQQQQQSTEVTNS